MSSRKKSLNHFFLNNLEFLNMEWRKEYFYKISCFNIDVKRIRRIIRRVQLSLLVLLFQNNHQNQQIKDRKLEEIEIIEIMEIIRIINTVLQEMMFKNLQQFRFFQTVLFYYIYYIIFLLVYNNAEKNYYKSPSIFLNYYIKIEKIELNDLPEHYVTKQVYLKDIYKC